jgi:hypothetical protein
MEILGGIEEHYTLSGVMAAVPPWVEERCRSRVEWRLYRLGFHNLNAWRVAVPRLSQNSKKKWLPEISAKPEEPVDYAKRPFTSTLLPSQRDQPGFTRPAHKSDPRSEIAATIQCLMSAYARF